MNPKITITVDAKNKAIASFDGIASVGAKVDVEVRGLPSGIVDFGAGDDWSGPSLRLRILDEDGNDIVRFPLEKKTSTKVSGGDQWTKTTASGADTYTNKTGTVVDFDTDGLREQFSGESYDASKSFGIILDSAVDKAEFAVGKIKIRQWLMASVDDPTVLPNWTEIQEKLNTVDAKVEKPVGSTTATITITNTMGVTTTATISDGVGGGDMKHSEFSEVTTLTNATLNQVASKVNEIINKLKPATAIVMAMLGFAAFGDLGPTTQFGDVPPSSTLSQVVTAGGGGSGGIDATTATNIATAVVASSNLCTVATAQAMTNDDTIVRASKELYGYYFGKTEFQFAGGLTIGDNGSIRTPASCDIGGVTLDFNGHVSCRDIYSTSDLSDWWIRKGHEEEKTVESYLTSLEWHPENAKLSDYGIEDAYTMTQIDGNTVTNGGAVAYFSTNADYVLTNLAANAAAATLASGTIANLATSGNALTVTLSLGGNYRSCDALLRLVNTSDVSLAITTNSNVALDGAWPSTIKAGTNLVMFTKTAYENGKSIITATSKEIK